MLDSRIIDLSLNKIFVKLILGEEVPVTLATLKVNQPHTIVYSPTTFVQQLVDTDLANSLIKLQGFSLAKVQNDKVRAEERY